MRPTTGGFSPRSAIEAAGPTDLNEVRLRALVGALELFRAVAVHQARLASSRDLARSSSGRVAAREAHRRVAELLDHALRGARGSGSPLRRYARTVSRLWLAIRELERRASRPPADASEATRAEVYQAASLHLGPILRDADRAPSWLRQISR